MYKKGYEKAVLENQKEDEITPRAEDRSDLLPSNYSIDVGYPHHFGGPFAGRTRPILAGRVGIGPEQFQPSVDSRGLGRMDRSVGWSPRALQSKAGRHRGQCAPWPPRCRAKVAVAVEMGVTE